MLILVFSPTLPWSYAHLLLLISTYYFASDLVPISWQWFCTHSSNPCVHMRVCVCTFLLLFLSWHDISMFADMLFHCLSTNNPGGMLRGFTFGQILLSIWLTRLVWLKDLLANIWSAWQKLPIHWEECIGKPFSLIFLHLFHFHAFPKGLK